MLDLAERLDLLEKSLSKQSPLELLRELEQYERKGPLAIDFLDSLKKSENSDNECECSCPKKSDDCQNSQSQIYKL